MGCGSPGEKHNTVPIQNSLITLLISNQNDLLMKRIKLEGKNFDYDAQLNFKGDTVLHYAAIRNNQQIIEYIFKNIPAVNPHPVNNDGLRPIDVAKKPQIKELFIKQEQSLKKNPQSIIKKQTQEKEQYKKEVQKAL